MPIQTQSIKPKAPLASLASGRWAIMLPVPPSTNTLWEPYSYLVDGRRMPGMRESKASKQYKAMVRARCAKAGIVPLRGAIGIRITYYRAKKIGDLSNRIKVLEDALNGVAYVDDGQIDYIEMHRKDDPKKPRVEVEIWTRNLEGK